MRHPGLISRDHPSFLLVEAVRCGYMSVASELSEESATLLKVAG